MTYYAIQSEYGSDNEEYKRIQLDIKHAELDLQRSQSHLQAFGEHLKTVLQAIDEGAQYIYNKMKANIESGNAPFYNC